MIIFKTKKIFRELYDIFKEGTLFGVSLYIAFKCKLKSLNFSNNEFKKSKKLNIIGAGTYQVSINIPSAIKSNFIINSIFTNGSVSGELLSKLFKNSSVTNSFRGLKKTDAVLIGSPHHLHPRHLLEVIKSDQYIYCEKPVAIDKQGIDFIKKNILHNQNSKKIMVGFNRRFAPLIQILINSKILDKTALEINYRVNFGKYVDNNLTDPKVGGGRLIGSCCHYVDLMTYLANSDVSEVSAFGIKSKNKMSENTFSCILKFKNGSIGNLNFTSSGDRTFVY